MRDNHLFVECDILTFRWGSQRYNFGAWAVAAVLAAASAAVVVWQNVRLAVLWDVSYILENATRIASGDVPYRDFPFPYAPLTFVVQAAIIKLFGRVYWHHIAYAAIACAAATALTVGLARRLGTRGSIVLCIPLALLGIYCIFPHPFYDPDCCLLILGLLAALLTERRPMLVGALCVTPLFVKQNIGLAFVAALFVLLVIERRWRIVAGILIGGAVALVAVEAIFGIANYARWTLAFAAERRLPPLASMWGIYADADLWWQVAFVVTGLVLRKVRWLATLLISTPWLWTAWRFFVTDDPNEREINLLRAWPLLLVVATLAAIASWRETRGIARIVPLLLVGTIHGAFLSQQTWGSTYGMWPLLVLLMVIALRGCEIPAYAIIAAVMLLSAALYVRGEERLTYVKWSDGAPSTSRIASLRGLRMRGAWLPDFDELVTWTERNIPRGDGILSLPGEDLFYFATGRRPRFPVLMFDRTINPYAPDAIAALAAERGIRWVIVKRQLQLNGTPFPELGDTIHLLRGHYEPVAFLRNYVIFRRIATDRADRSTESNGETAISVDERPAAPVEMSPKSFILVTVP